MWLLQKLGVFLFFSMVSESIRRLSSSNRPPSPQPFQVSTVAAGTRAPVLGGTFRVRPIPVWVGGVTVKQVVTFDTPKLLGIIVGGTQQFKVGYEYGITMQGLLCWGKIAGDRGVVNMVFGENKLLSDQSFTQTVSDPSGMAPLELPTIGGPSPWVSFAPLPLVLDVEVYRGGRATQVVFLPRIYGEPGSGGGVKGTVTLAIGSRQYGPDPLMEDKLGAGNVPSYGDYATVVYDNLIVGESPAPPPIDYIVTRHIPEFAGINSRAIVGRSGRSWTVVDSSHAAMLYEGLSHPFFGAGDRIPAWQIDKASFLAAHARLASENLGGSMLWGSSSVVPVSTRQQLREECERTCGGVLRRNPETFKWEFKLIRNEATSPSARAALPHYDEHHFTSFEWTRADPRETINALTVEFSNAETIYRSDTVRATNNANIADTRSVREATVQYLTVTSRDTALQLLARDLKQRSTALGRGKGKATRALWRASIGDVIRVSSDEHELDDVLVRVLDVDLGMPENAEITVTLAEDIFGLDAVVRSDVPAPPVLTLPQIVRPQVTGIEITEVDGVATVAITVLDPEHRLIDISTQTKSGTGAASGWASVASASPDTSDPTFPYNDHVTDDDLSGTYTVMVPLSDTGVSAVAYRLQFIGYSTIAAPTSDVQEIVGEVPLRQLPPTSAPNPVVVDHVSGPTFVFAKSTGRQVFSKH